MLLLSQIIHTALLGFAVYCAFGAVLVIGEKIIRMIKEKAQCINS